MSREAFDKSDYNDSKTCVTITVIKCFLIWKKRVIMHKSLAFLAPGNQDP